MAASTMLSQLNFLVDFFGTDGCKTRIDLKSKIPYVLTGDGNQINGIATISKYLLQNSSYSNGLLGKSLEEEALIDQWLEYRSLDLEYACKSDFHVVLKELNLYLEDKVYFVGNKFSLADLILFCGLREIYTILGFKEKEKYIHLSRWFNLVQHDNSVMKHFPPILFSKTRLY